MSCKKECSTFGEKKGHGPRIDYFNMIVYENFLLGKVYCKGSVIKRDKSTFWCIEKKLLML
jgi:hypothetical protein